MLDNLSQNWNLRFTNTNIEMSFKEEFIKLHKISSLLVISGLILLSIYFVLVNLLPTYFLAFFAVPLVPHSLLRNLSLELASLVFIEYNYSKGTIAEFLGCLLPSFLLQFFIWKRWELFFAINIVKLLSVGPLETLNALVSVMTYTLLTFLFEKDFRSNWRKMRKHKEENYKYRELWMKIPYPVVIVSQRFRIVLMNYAADRVFCQKGMNMQEKNLEGLFTLENYDIICRLIRSVSDGKEKEEVFLKENNTVYLAVIKCVEWKFERCVELSLIEIVEASFNDKIFNLFYFSQEQCLEELNNAIINNYKTKEKVQPAILEIFYRFCINYWSYQLYLEQQSECNFSQETKTLDFPSEIINSIEYFNVKSSDKCLDFRFTNESSKATIICNEIRIKLFLHVIIDYAKSTAESDSLIEFTLQSFETNNTICYTFTCNFSASDIKHELLVLIFENKRKSYEDFESFAKKFSLSYALFSSNLRALKIEVKQIAYSKKKVTLSFFIRFPISIDSLVPISLKFSNRFNIGNSRILWYGNGIGMDKTQVKLNIEHQTGIGIGLCHKSHNNIIIKLNDDQLRDENKLIRSPKSMPSIQKIPSFSSIADIFLNPNKIRRASTTIKLRRSKNNTFESPNYSTTNKRQVKRFLYTECLKILNYEVGVYRVLIVDDFEENRKVLQELLRKVMTVSCEFAKDGIGAVDMYDNYSSQGYMYQIIFMDLIMPRLNGYQASVRIRQRENEKHYPKTFICAISGNRDCVSKCLESQIDYVAFKPLSVSLLEAIIRQKKEVSDKIMV
ncbi:hypothetical protein SteCoe_15881 [Stentor coeruleus]|uniref:Response regulatory domain-containing protein n=1 Tax=Stentor coeruleus TaxID=5963 RepID=A0A1R2C2P7_9CILI|nr:hypothetical protein SteCoe_15881 [Stentor coeruleus]